MINYILRRLFNMIPLLLGVTVLSFGIMKLAPGDFLTTMALNPQIAPETIDLMRRQFGLDQPWYIQYWKWLIGILQFDFGYSFTYRVPVSTLILERVGNTLILSIGAAFISWSVALPLGVYSALYQNTRFDRIASFFSFTTISVPSFFLSLLGIFIAAKTGWCPNGGTVSANYNSPDLLGKIFDRLHHLILPVLVLGFIGTGSPVRQMRSNFLEVMRQPYATTARAKGLPESLVIWKHIFPNAVNPLITLLGFEIASLLSGAALTEIVFSWPGLGRLILEAVMSYDLYLVMGSLFMGTILLIMGNLIADILLAFMDPRIKL